MYKQSFQSSRLAQSYQRADSLAWIARSGEDFERMVEIIALRPNWENSSTADREEIVGAPALSRLED
ncbi:MAG: hypothetical protein AAFZ17_10570 [Cyanobacteria bacterium J06650_10]